MALNNTFGNQQAMPISENLEVQEGDYGLSFSRKWSRFFGILTLIFAVFWIGPLIDTYIDVFIDIFNIFSSNELGFVYLISCLILLLHLAAGLGLAYYGVASLVNKTNVTVSKNEISIKHTPLPWITAKTVNRIDLKQLYVCEVITVAKNYYFRSYSLKGIDQNNYSVDFIDDLESADTAKYLEQKIESFWKIENYPVIGEFNS